jgi:hypothetical protein
MASSNPRLAEGLLAAMMDGKARYVRLITTGMNDCIGQAQAFVREHASEPGETSEWDRLDWARIDERERCAELADQLGYFNVGEAIRARG